MGLRQWARKDQAFARSRKWRLYIRKVESREGALGHFGDERVPAFNRLGELRRSRIDDLFPLGGTFVRRWREDADFHRCSDHRLCIAFGESCAAGALQCERREGMQQDIGMQGVFHRIKRRA